MPFDLKLDHLPAGYAVGPGRPGDKVQVQITGFLSPDDGELLYKYLDGVSQTYLARLPSKERPPEGSIACLVAIVNRDQTARVYINEVKAIGSLQAKGAVEAGQFLKTDDVADIIGLRFDGITVPDDAGVVVVLSAGWRKGLFFDYGPLHGITRAFDLGTALARSLTFLWFRARLTFTETQWQQMFKQAWFPFVSLSGATLERMATHAQEGWKIDDLLDEIQQQVDARLPELRTLASSKPVLRAHQKTLERAIESYEKRDWLACCSLLYPRLEGILRSHMSKSAPSARVNQDTMAASVENDPSRLRHELSLLLPPRFRAYLDEVYFADFDPKQSVEHVGRNTVSHGVVSEDRLNRKSATVGMLILDQLTFLLP